jgi:hypothetical protein
MNIPDPQHYLKDYNKNEKVSTGQISKSGSKLREITLHLSVKKIMKTVDSSLWLNRLHKCKPVLRNFVNTDPEKRKKDAKATANLT